MTITYTTGIPDSNHNPSIDSPNMKINNDNNLQIWGIDHVTFNTSILPNGTHKQITFANNNVPAVPTTPPVLFTNTVAGLPQLFFYSGDAAHGQDQYVNNISGSTFLLGGIILKWGRFSGIGTGIVPLNFTASDGGAQTAFPNNCYTVIPVMGTAGGSAFLTISGAFSATTFTISRTGGPATATIYYLAIGN